MGESTEQYEEQVEGPKSKLQPVQQEASARGESTGQ